MHKHTRTRTRRARANAAHARTRARTHALTHTHPTHRAVSGTTVPDTWASVVAARLDLTADAAIANVFGSCAVNVFLGLGLPWTVASAYQAARGAPFEAPAGDLGFSVALFCGLAAAAVALLLAKRLLRGGELGGPTRADKYGTAAALAALWVTYVAASAARAAATAAAVEAGG
jgi:solute carrier family 8 (sodium/calcium exchanger)